MMLSGCGDDDASTVLQESGAPDAKTEALPVVEWYPTPKYSHQPRYYMPEQAPSHQVQQRVTQQYVQQPAWSGYGQPAPQQGWSTPPSTGYGTGVGVPVQGGYVQAPAWGQYVQPAQTYPVQPAQTYQLQPPQTVQQQPYYIQVPQPGYAQRPWGATDETASKQRAGQSIDTWQMTNQLPAWGTQPYGGYPMQSPGYYSVQPGAVQPGYYR